jgi:hypothetical protein
LLCNNFEGTTSCVAKERSTETYVRDVYMKYLNDLERYKLKIGKTRWSKTENCSRWHCRETGKVYTSHEWKLQQGPRTTKGKKGGEAFEPLNANNGQSPLKNANKAKLPIRPCPCLESPSGSYVQSMNARRHLDHWSPEAICDLSSDRTAIRRRLEFIGRRSTLGYLG